MKRIYALTFFIFLLLAPGIRGQGLFSFYSVSEGLAQSTVTSMYRDTFGYLWVGTGDGLSIFNGYEFRNFKSRYGDTTSLSNNRVRGILPSRDGEHVWVGTEDGVTIFERNALSTPRILRIPGWGGEALSPLWCNDTAMWLINPGKAIIRVNEKTGKIATQHTFQHQVWYDPHPLNTPGEFVFTDASASLVFYSIRKGETGRYPFPEALKLGDVHDALEMSDGTLLIATVRGLWNFDRKSGYWKQLPGTRHGQLDLVCLCRDVNGKIWLGARGEGLYLYDPADGSVRPCGWQQDGTAVKEKLREPHGIICDAYGVMWVGTNDAGLVKITTNHVFFGDQYLAPLVTDTCNWFVRSIYMNGRRQLFVGTFSEGLKVIDRQTGAIRQVNVAGNDAGSVNAIVPGPASTLYLGTDNGVVRLDTLKWAVTPVKCDSAANHLHVTCMLRCSDGKIFAGTSQYLFCINEKNGEPFLEGCFYHPINVSALYENSRGELLVASKYSGIVLFSKEGKLVEEVLFAGSGLSRATIVYSFVETGDGYWASSNTGLLRFSSSLSAEKIITDKDGLPENTLYGLLQLPGGELFISTGKGISIFNPSTNRFMNYSSADGMKSDECNSRAVLFADGCVFVGGVNGFDYAGYPFRSRQFPLPVVLLDQQQVFDEPFISKGEGFYTSRMELGFRENTFSFMLWQTDFAFSERADFHYRLEGFDENILAAGNKRFVRYAGVIPGDYNFEASVTLPGGITSVPQRMLEISVVPPFWQTAWFRITSILGALLFVSLSLYLVLVTRYRRRLRKLQLQQELERVRVRISADIHDDIGAGLTRIALAGDLATMQLPENDPQKQRVAGMAASARVLSQSLKEVVWSVRPEYDRSDNMIRYFRDYCGEYFEATSIRCTFNTGATLPVFPVSPEIRRNLFLILKEALNNIAKHAEAEQVNVAVKVEGKNFTLSVRDDGRGISAAVAGENMRAHGLKGMRKRAEAIGFSFDISPGEKGGTRVTVSGRLK